MRACCCLHVQVRLATSLLAYFGPGANSSDPRAGWTSDQRARLQLLALSLLQARAARVSRAYRMRAARVPCT